MQEGRLDGGLFCSAQRQRPDPANYHHADNDYGFNSDNKDEIIERTGIAGLNLDWRQSADVIEARLSFKLNGFEAHVPMK